MSFFSKIFKKEYSHFFIYKWGIFGGAVESALIILATFAFTSLISVFSNFYDALSNPLYMVFSGFYWVIFSILSLVTVFGMPFFLAFKKNRFHEAFTVLLISIVTLFVFMSFLILISTL